MITITLHNMHGPTVLAADIHHFGELFRDWDRVNNSNAGYYRAITTIDGIEFELLPRNVYVTAADPLYEDRRATTSRHRFSRDRNGILATGCGHMIEHLDHRFSEPGTWLWCRDCFPFEVDF